MIKFFRRIRKRLLTESKIGKYLLYALGEIILVVIGILIALQINNWNEQRKLDETTRVILRQVQLDILENIETAEWAKNRFNRKDSIFWVMKQKELTPSDFAGAENRTFRAAINTRWGFEMKNKGFEDLKIHPGLKPGEYVELIDSLEWLEEEFLYFNELIQRIKKGQEEHFAYRQANYDWYSAEFWTGKVSDEELEFYANSPIIRNLISYRSHNMYQALTAADRYVIMGREIYQTIAEILDQEKDKWPEVIKDYYADIPIDSMVNFTGTYLLHYAPPLNSLDRYSMLDSLNISIVENKLTIKKYVKDDIFEMDLSIRSHNKLEEIDWYRRIHYSINEDGFLRVKDIIGLAYLFRKKGDLFQ